MEEQEKNAVMGDVDSMLQLINKLLDQGGWDVVKEAINSQDPAQPLGAFIAQLIMQITEQMAQSGQDMDLRAWLMPGGIVEVLLDMFEAEFDLPPEFSDEIFKNVVKNIQAALQEPQQPQQGQPAPAPQGGLQGMAQGGM
jgi:hypothetical protein